MLLLLTAAPNRKPGSERWSIWLHCILGAQLPTGTFIFIFNFAFPPVSLWLSHLAWRTSPSDSNDAFWVNSRHTCRISYDWLQRWRWSDGGHDKCMEIPDVCVFFFWPNCYATHTRLSLNLHLLLSLSPEPVQSWEAITGKCYTV